MSKTINCTAVKSWFTKCKEGWGYALTIFSIIGIIYNFLADNVEEPLTSLKGYVHV